MALFFLIFYLGRPLVLDELQAGYQSPSTQLILLHYICYTAYVIFY